MCRRAETSVSRLSLSAFSSHFERPRLPAVDTVVSQEAQTSCIERDAENVLSQIERYVEAASAKRSTELS